MVSKAERAQTLHAVAQAAGARAAVLPLIESVAGLDAADALAAAPQVVRLAYGHLDFQVDAGMACEQGEEELLPMAHGPGPGLAPRRHRRGRGRRDGGHAQPLNAWPGRGTRAAHGLWRQAVHHPAQVQPLHAVFDPDAAAVAHAQRLRQALAEAGGGVCVLTAAWSMRPVLKQAEQVLLRHAWAQQRSAARS